MSERGAESFLLPGREANAPDQFEGGVGSVRRNRLLQRKQLVVSVNRFSTRDLRCGPWSPLVINVPIEKLPNFRALLHRFGADLTRAVINGNLRLEFGSFRGTLGERDPQAQPSIK